MDIGEMVSVETMIRATLERLGCDGLYNADGDCGCSALDMNPSGCLNTNCVAAIETEVPCETCDDRRHCLLPGRGSMRCYRYEAAAARRTPWPEKEPEMSEDVTNGEEAAETLLSVARCLSVLRQSLSDMARDDLYPTISCAAPMHLASQAAYRRVARAVLEAHQAAAEEARAVATSAITIKSEGAE